MGDRRRNKLAKKRINLTWSDDNQVVVHEGLNTNDLLCITQVPYAIEGTIVQPRIEGVDNPEISAKNQVGEKRDKHQYLGDKQ